MKLALFSSVGTHSYLIDHYMSHMIEKCDLYVNYYAENKDTDTYANLVKCAKYLDTQCTTKFPALKKCYKLSDIKNYDYVLVYDDDFILESGNILTIPTIMDSYKLDIGSSCHSNQGRMSHSVMRHCEGSHIFRYVNFIEMNFPIFSKKALYEYMNVYDGKLCGCGNDWWYLNTLESYKQKNCAIVDSVCVVNPHHAHKIGHTTINKFMPDEERLSEWKNIQQHHMLFEWVPSTVEFVYS